MLIKMVMIILFKKENSIIDHINHHNCLIFILIFILSEEFSEEFIIKCAP